MNFDTMQKFNSILNGYLLLNTSYINDKALITTFDGNWVIPCSAIIALWFLGSVFVNK